MMMNFRVSDEEYQAYLMAATEAKMTISAWARDCLTEYARNKGVRQEPVRQDKNDSKELQPKDLQQKQVKYSGVTSKLCSRCQRVGGSKDCRQCAAILAQDSAFVQ